MKTWKLLFLFIGLGELTWAKEPTIAPSGRRIMGVRTSVTSPAPDASEMPKEHEKETAKPKSASASGGQVIHPLRPGPVVKDWRFPCKVPADRLQPIVIMGEEHYLASSKKNRELNVAEARANQFLLALEGPVCIRCLNIQTPVFAQKAYAGDHGTHPLIQGYDDSLTHGLALLTFGYHNVGGKEGNPARNSIIIELPINPLLIKSLHRMKADIMPTLQANSPHARVLNLLEAFAKETDIDSANRRWAALQKKHPWHSDGPAVNYILRQWSKYLLEVAQAEYAATGQYFFPELPEMTENAFRGRQEMGQYLDDVILNVRNYYMVKNLAALYCQKAVPLGIPMRVITGLAHVKGLTEMLKADGPPGLVIQTFEVKQAIAPGENPLIALNPTETPDQIRHRRGKK